MSPVQQQSPGRITDVPQADLCLKHFQPIQSLKAQPDIEGVSNGVNSAQNKFQH